jgi:hypothetical protein
MSSNYNGNIQKYNKIKKIILSQTSCSILEIVCRKLYVKGVNTNKKEPSIWTAQEEKMNARVSIPYRYALLIRL